MATVPTVLAHSDHHHATERIVEQVVGPSTVPAATATPGPAIDAGVVAQIAEHPVAHVHAHGADLPAALLILVVAVPLAFIAALLLRRRPLIAAIGACSAAAAVIHAVVIPDHFGDVAIGGFFVAVTALQLAWAALAPRHPSGPVLAAGMAGNLVVLIIWAVSRTSGLPFGPAAGHVEAVGVLDGAVAAYEAAVVAGCLWLARTAPATTLRWGILAPAPVRAE